MDKVAEIEKAEKAKMKQKVDKILKHDIKSVVLAGEPYRIAVS